MKNSLEKVLVISVITLLLPSCATEIKNNNIAIYPNKAVIKKNEATQFVAIQSNGVNTKDVSHDMVWSAIPTNVYHVSNESASIGLVTSSGDADGYVAITPKSLIYPLASFQKFDNEYNLGYGISDATLKNGRGKLTVVSNTFLELNIERLFDNGVWIDINANLAISSNSNQANGIGSGQSAFNQQPNLGGLNGKVGYAFNLIQDHILLTPYIMGGRNTNMSASVIKNNNNANIINYDFYYTGGGGVRLEYRINNLAALYIDQLAAYNLDQSNPINSLPQNNMMFTTSVGTKFNVLNNLQLGVQGFYSTFQPMSTIPMDNTGTTVYTPCNCGTYGGTVTIGLTY